MTATAPATASANAVNLSGLRRVFDNGVVALEGIDLNIAAGEFVALLGPSGCGKSTLLRLIAGLDQPQAGHIEIAAASGYALDGHESSVAFVFQDAHLLPWRNVLRNVALPLELMHVPASQREQASREALDSVGLADLTERFPAQLSGGQRMRVSLARAMVTRPPLLLLDEPFAALDEITRQRLDDQLRQLWAVRRMTVIFVTHSTTEAAYLADRAIVMSPRPGRIVADHRLDLPTDRTPVLRGTAGFAREVRGLYEALERGGA